METCCRRLRISEASATGSLAAQFANCFSVRPDICIFFWHGYVIFGEWLKGLVLLSAVWWQEP